MAFGRGGKAGVESATGNGTPDWNMGPVSKARQATIPRHPTEMHGGHFPVRPSHAQMQTFQLASKSPFRLPQTKQMTRRDSVFENAGCGEASLPFYMKVQQVKSKKTEPWLVKSTPDCGVGGQEQRLNIWSKMLRLTTLRREDGYCFPDAGRINRLRGACPEKAESNIPTVELTGCRQVRMGEVRKSLGQPSTSAGMDLGQAGATWSSF
ncbi:hypothetical protein B0T21DRAFT_198382 [Apiosordaria backusii]|uniref:Uncharacterized protein n=1 Tax=Apiosordaria backusii TaxID=314023 RepID=A0AA40BE91_9PEZI|nr:hypothetical protein B0T21DRAFT_198382 [Apiosordaria backusii]